MVLSIKLSVMLVHFESVNSQDLNIFITTELSDAEVGFFEDDREISSVHTETFAKKQEWGIYEFVHFTPKDLTQEYANKKFKKPGMRAFCSAGRKPGFFVWNVIVLMVRKFEFFGFTFIS
jgi:hypothetical protein